MSVDDWIAQERIIPALAGNTFAPVGDRGQLPDHPRAGGEHFSSFDQLDSSTGSSPRWRGTLTEGVMFSSTVRIIPALAGNTKKFIHELIYDADHPRAGGEHTLLSPRVSTPYSRIIPALAGNTSVRWPQWMVPADHPRAGGEHSKKGIPNHLDHGSSPRWRGTPPSLGFDASQLRIIPALAGNTTLPRKALIGFADHPRAGGEHPYIRVSGVPVSGSSPRWRGTHSYL